MLSLEHVYTACSFFFCFYREAGIMKGNINDSCMKQGCLTYTDEKGGLIMLELKLKSGEVKQCEAGAYVHELLEAWNVKEAVYAVTLDGKLHDLNYRIKKSGALDYIYADSETGKLIYERSLNFLFIVAVRSLFPDARVRMEHALIAGHIFATGCQPGIPPRGLAFLREVCHAASGDPQLPKKDMVHCVVHSLKWMIS